MADAPTITAAPWHASGGDNTRRGLFAGTVRLRAKPVRTLRARGAIQASTVCDAAGRIFVADMAGWVLAFDPDGRPLWSRQLQGGIAASPVVDCQTNRLFVGTLSGWAYALDNPTGAVQWKKEIPTTSDPRILSDLLHLPKNRLLVLSSWGGKFHALDDTDGATRFSWDAGFYPSAGASADRAETLYCVRAVPEQGIQFVRVSTDGQETVLHHQPGQGRSPNRQIAAAAPALDEERRMVYCVANTGQTSLLLAWSEPEQKMLWTHPIPASVQATPAILQTGTTVLADLAGTVHAVAPDGSTRYHYASGCEYLIAATVCDRDATVFLGDPLGRIHAIDSDGSGQVLFETPRAIQARPAFDRSGNLLVPSTDQQLYLFRNRAN